MTSSPLGIGIDTGGTFTDIVLFDLQGGRVLRKQKTPTTHGDYTVCIARAFQSIDLAAGERAGLGRVCLSTTLATNAVAENRVHPSCLLVEPGDIRVPPGLHPRLVLLNSWLSFDTMEVIAVSKREVLEKTRQWAGEVESFAVSGYASTRSPAHEQQIGAILREAYGKPVVLGSELTHRLNFLQRASAAALNAGLLPVIMEWLGAVRSILEGLEITCPLYIVKGDGSLMEEREALSRPVQTLFSGPAASLQGGSRLSGLREALVIDVGGTTTDIGRVKRGRGEPSKGGLRINQQQIAVDGLDIFTMGLGGDSRLRLGGRNHLFFENRRALPICRAVEQCAGFSLEGLEAAAAGLWHFGDPSLLDTLALDSHYSQGQAGNHGAPLTGNQLLLLEQLGQGPRTSRQLAAGTGLPDCAGLVEELVRRRVLIRIAFTPTDLHCAGGAIPGFSEQAAAGAVALHARMLDMSPAAFRAAAHEALRRQTSGLLLRFLGGFDPVPEPGEPLLERLVTMLHRPPRGQQPTLALDARQPLVLVGAAAPLLFAHAPGPLKRRLLHPEHGEVANAVGAITTRFVLREGITVEPLKRGGVELFDHQGRRPFDSLEEALASGKEQLTGELSRQARELRLTGLKWEWRQEIMEDYADFSRRTRKELIIARLEALLTGIPE